MESLYEVHEGFLNVNGNLLDGRRHWHEDMESQSNSGGYVYSGPGLLSDPPENDFPQGHHRNAVEASDIESTPSRSTPDLLVDHYHYASPMERHFSDFDYQNDRNHNEYLQTFCPNCGQVVRIGNPQPQERNYVLSLNPQSLEDQSGSVSRENLLESSFGAHSMQSYRVSNRDADISCSVCSLQSSMQNSQNIRISNQYFSRFSDAVENSQSSGVLNRDVLRPGSAVHGVQSCTISNQDPSRSGSPIQNFQSDRNSIQHFPRSGSSMQNSQSGRISNQCFSRSSDEVENSQSSEVLNIDVLRPGSAVHSFQSCTFSNKDSSRSGSPIQNSQSGRMLNQDFPRSDGPMQNSHDRIPNQNFGVHGLQSCRVSNGDAHSSCSADSLQSTTSYQGFPRSSGAVENFQSSEVLNRDVIRTDSAVHSFQNCTISNQDFSRSGGPMQNSQSDRISNQNFPRSVGPMQNSQSDRISNQNFPRSGSPMQYSQSDRISNQDFPRSGGPMQNSQSDRISNQNFPRSGTPKPHSQIVRIPNRKFQRSFSPVHSFESGTTRDFPNSVHSVNTFKSSRHSNGDVPRSSNAVETSPNERVSNRDYLRPGSDMQNFPSHYIPNGDFVRSGCTVPNSQRGRIQNVDFLRSGSDVQNFEVQEDRKPIKAFKRSGSLMYGFQNGSISNGDFQSPVTPVHTFQNGGLSNGNESSILSNLEESTQITFRAPSCTSLSIMHEGIEMHPLLEDVTPNRSKYSQSCHYKESDKENYKMKHKQKTHLDSIQKSSLSRGDKKKRGYDDDCLITYTSDTSKQRESAAIYLEARGYKVVTDIPSSLMENLTLEKEKKNMGKLKRVFQTCGHVLCIISKEYIKEITQKKAREEKLHTRFLANLMKEEYAKNGKKNKRFLPIFVDDKRWNNIPDFLKKYPKDEQCKYQELFNEALQ